MLSLLFVLGVSADFLMCNVAPNTTVHSYNEPGHPNYIIEQAMHAQSSNVIVVAEKIYCLADEPKPSPNSTVQIKCWECPTQSQLSESLRMQARLQAWEQNERQKDLMAGLGFFLFVAVFFALMLCATLNNKRSTRHFCVQHDVIEQPHEENKEQKV